MRFEFATAARIVFGAGAITDLPMHCGDLAPPGPLLVVTGRHAQRWDDVLQLLKTAGWTSTGIPITGEPTTGEVIEGARMAREAKARLVVAIGGGSALDAGKAIAAMAVQPGPLFDYLEVVGQARPLAQAALPLIAIPTTAGTGAEVTRNAVLTSPEHRVKASLRHSSMLPRLALIDPALAVTAPAAVTAASGMDALTQCLEALVSCRAQPLTDALCIDGIGRAARSLERAVTNGGDMAAREDLALAAMFSGMALANAGLGLVHAFAAPIGGMLSAPHGAVCAALVAPCWAANLRAVSRRGSAETKGKFKLAARLLTGDQGAQAETGTEWLAALTQRLEMRRLGDFGLTNTMIDDVVRKAAAASSMKGNPVPLDPAEMAQALADAL